jgi:hypothetical protein
MGMHVDDFQRMTPWWSVPVLTAILAAPLVTVSAPAAATAQMQAERSIPMQPADGEEILPDDARAVAISDLATLASCRDGEGAPHLAVLQRLRTLHLLAVDEASRMDEAWAAQQELQSTAWGRSAEGAAVAEAFAGALHALEGRHGFWPHRRVRDLRRGLELLDRQVESHPEQVEVRYLRLVSGAFLPAVLGRGDAVRDDLDALAHLLPAAAGRYPLRTWTGMADAVEAILADRDPGRAARARPVFRSARAAATAADLPLAPGCRVG